MGIAPIGYPYRWGQKPMAAIHKCPTCGQETEAREVQYKPKRIVCTKCGGRLYGRKHRKSTFLRFDEVEE